VAEGTEQSILASTVAPKKELVSELAGDELLLHDSDTQATVYLNGPAAVIFRLLDGTRTGEQIADLLTEAYPDAGSEVRQDTAEALNDFIGRGLAEKL